MDRGQRMIDRGKRDILGVEVDVVDYAATVDRILAAARLKQPLSVSALAVHGIMTGRLDPDQRHRLNSIDIVAPDGQPVRWALRVLHGESLPSRVYGPDLMLKVCEAAAEQGVSIYLFGGQQDALDELQAALVARFKRLRIAGSSPSAFSRVTNEVNAALIHKIRSSGAGILFVGLGCPRQEVWIFENRTALGMPAIAVGAAFDFLSGRKKQAPAGMQDLGLEWLFRFMQEPRRLWRRYIGLNTLYCCLIALQMLGIAPAMRNSRQVKRLNYG
jgi:exopolysaccharide biosynthesis WecB/TagA/CpsF family protein